MDSLQELLDNSFATASGHLLSIMTPERRLAAARLRAELPCPAVLTVATVTARGEPRISAVDGHFLDDAWHFTTAADSPKATQLSARPAVSAAFTPRDGYGVFCHGRVVNLDGEAKQMLRQHFIDVYEHDPETWGNIAYYRIEADWMVGFAMTESEMAEIEAARAARRRG